MWDNKYSSVIRLYSKGCVIFTVHTKYNLRPYLPPREKVVLSVVPMEKSVSSVEESLESLAVS